MEGGCSWKRLEGPDPRKKCAQRWEPEEMKKSSKEAAARARGKEIP